MCVVLGPGVVGIAPAAFVLLLCGLCIVEVTTPMVEVLSPCLAAVVPALNMVFFFFSCIFLFCFVFRGYHKLCTIASMKNVVLDLEMAHDVVTVNDHKKEQKPYL